MKKNSIITLSILCVFTFILVYSIHLEYSLPYHADEWHHITQSLKLMNGEYPGGQISYEIVFHLFLGLLSKAFNLLDIYQFVPAIWAVFSILSLFFVVYDTTKNEYIGLLAMLFFMSIKSNTNILGLWFFTPLSFSIPFVFLYVHFLNKSLLESNNKYLVISVFIASALLFTHPISVLFSLPALLIVLIYHRQVILQSNFYSELLFIPVILGSMFFTYTEHIISLSVFLFKYGWTRPELNTSLFEIYSIVGYIFAGFGAYFTIFGKKIKQLLPYITIPSVLFISIILFKIFGISVFSPFQRNIYYLSLFMPFLSAIGVYSIYKKITATSFFSSYKNKILLTLCTLFLIIILFSNYYKVPAGTELYKIIETEDIEYILLLSDGVNNTILAPADISLALYPLIQKNPFAAIAFYGNRSRLDYFYSVAANCKERNFMLDRNNISYIISDVYLPCDWSILYKKDKYVFYRGEL